MPSLTTGSYIYATCRDAPEMLVGLGESFSTAKRVMAARGTAHQKLKNPAGDRGFGACWKAGWLASQCPKLLATLPLAIFDLPERGCRERMEYHLTCREDACS